MKGLQRSFQRLKTSIQLMNCAQYSIISVSIAAAIITKSGTVDERVHEMNIGEWVMEIVQGPSRRIEVVDLVAEVPLGLVMVDLQKPTPVVIPDVHRGPDQWTPIGNGVNHGTIQRKTKDQKRRTFQSLKWVWKDHLLSNRLNLAFQTIVLIYIVILIPSILEYLKTAPNCCT